MRPTWPEEFASPSGNCEDSELSSSRGGLDRVAGDRDEPRALEVLEPVAVDVGDARGEALVVVLDPGHVRLGAQVELARRLGARQLDGQRRPLRGVLDALEVEAVLVRRGPAVVGDRGGRVAAGVEALVADALGAVREHLVVVVGRQLRDAVRARAADLRLGPVVVRLDVGERDRPVQRVDAVQAAQVGRGLELVLHEARTAAGPVHRRAADRLAGPGGEVREVLRDPERAGRRAVVEPGELLERAPLVVDEVVGRVVATRLEHDDLHALLAQLVRERPAAGPGSHDDDDILVVEAITRHARPPRRGAIPRVGSSSMGGSGSQSRSSKPRSR